MIGPYRKADKMISNEEAELAAELGSYVASLDPESIARHRRQSAEANAQRGGTRTTGFRASNRSAWSGVMNIDGARRYFGPPCPKSS